MKILAVSDQVVEGLYSPQICDRFGDVDLVLSCGDLPYSYLEYIVTLLNIPCLFVHGNHDQPEYTATGRTLTEPGGWINIDEKTVAVKGVLIAGLEGAVRYKPRGDFQYTEAEMAHKALRLAPALMLNRVRYGRYLDVLVTHAPPYGIHNDQDIPHRGFKTFLWLMRRFRPRYLLHGHKHVYKPQSYRTRYMGTEVINVYPFRIIEW